MTKSATNPPLGTPKLAHFTPLRYPGGKGKLAGFIKRLLERNSLLDGEYVEPYAGGAAIALELLLQEYVTRVHINDISRPVSSFWKAVLEHTNDLARLTVDTPITVESWDKQKRVFQTASEHDDLTLGFATFFLNRTNRSGILNGGIIGGREQTGAWKIDARYNPWELVARIEQIARHSSRISLTCSDAADFIRSGSKEWPSNTLLYLDPPYFRKGKDLYYDFYSPEDHASIAELMRSVRQQRWIVSYDNVPEVRSLYSAWRSITYGLGYSARDSRQGSEVMFFDDELAIPEIVGAMRALDGPTEPVRPGDVKN